MENYQDVLKDKAEHYSRINTIKNFTDIRDIALYVADQLLSEAEYLSWEYGEGDEESEEMKLLNKLYTVIHSAVEVNQCFHVHDNWREETKEMWQLFLKDES